MPQEQQPRAPVIRLTIVALICVGFWALARYETYRPPVLAADAPAARFSATRAEGILARILGPERPHPASTDENGAVRERILREYAALGVPTKTYRALGCHMNKDVGALACATVTDILAQVRPGNGKAIIMLSHYDSVPAGPGAADDESGTAAVIESARALKAIRDPGVHPILAVNTDGEEFGLLGAAAFLDNHQMKSLVGAVVNVEARGNQGPSLLFQTSPGDGPLINLYADSVHAFAASSLFPVIYKFLPNDTDLTLFIRDGFPSWNFAFLDRVAHYHTTLDRRENLDPQSLQMQGENLLGVTNSLAHTDFGILKGGDDIFISILGRWLPRLPASWAIPLSFLALALVLLTIARPGSILPSFRGWFAALAVLPLTLVAAGVSGWVLHTTAVLVSGQPDPSYAHPSYLRIALSFGVLASVVLTSRLADERKSAISLWLWFALLAVLCSLFAVGLSPYFLFPLLVAAPILAAVSIGKIDGRPLQVAFALASVPALVIWFSIVAVGETLSGLSLHPLFTVPAAIGLAIVAPILSDTFTRRAWIACSSLIFALSFAIAVIGGLQPAYDRLMPQRLSIQYIEDATKGRAVWAADASAPLPSTLRSAANFSPVPEIAYPYGFLRSFIAPAGSPQFAAPTAQVMAGSPSRGGLRHIDIALHASSFASQVILAVPRETKLRAITLDGKRFVVPVEWAKSPLPYNLIACFSNDCGHKTVGLDFASREPARLLLSEVRYGLPEAGRRLAAARPATATQSQNGDTTVLINAIALPGA